MSIARELAANLTVAFLSHELRFARKDGIIDADSCIRKAIEVALRFEQLLKEAKKL